VPVRSVRPWSGGRLTVGIGYAGQTVRCAYGAGPTAGFGTGYRAASFRPGAAIVSRGSV